MKKILFLITTLTLTSSIFAAAEFKCYERVYSEAHMSAHVGQSLKSIKLSTYKEGRETTVSIKATSEKDGLSYSFSASQPVDGNICAEFMADGDEDEGCLNINNISNNVIEVSPVSIKNYLSWEQEMTANNLILMRCEGQTSDGEGCMSGFKSINLSPRNSEDRTYRLYKVSCKSFW